MSAQQIPTGDACALGDKRRLHDGGLIPGLLDDSLRVGNPGTSTALGCGYVRLGRGFKKIDGRTR